MQRTTHTRPPDALFVGYAPELNPNELLWSYMERTGKAKNRRYARAIACSHPSTPTYKPFNAVANAD
jgi:hypothetical protein